MIALPCAPFGVLAKQRGSSSGPLQRALCCVWPGCCSPPAARPPDNGSGTATVLSDSTQPSPKRTLEVSCCILPMTTERPEPALPGSAAGYIVLQMESRQFPALWKTAGYTSHFSCSHYTTETAEMVVFQRFSAKSIRFGGLSHAQPCHRLVGFRLLNFQPLH